MHHAQQQESIFVRWARAYGWRAFAVPVLVVITAWVLWDVAVPPSHHEEMREQAIAEHLAATGPDPATMTNTPIAVESLPAGGPYTQRGDGTYRVVGAPGAQGGQGTERVIRYVVEVEGGVDTSAVGGDDAFAQLVDATLTHPKGWTHDPRFRFEHVAPDQNPNFRIQLTSVDSTHALCGNELRMETSCFYSAGNRVVINESRWVRGATPFEGDLGSYRQYLLNHEVGHGLGYAHHQPCGGQGELAPVMMQQTLSLNNSELHSFDPTEVYPDNHQACRFNPWPYPKV